MKVMQTIETEVGFEVFKTLFSAQTPDHILKKQWDLNKDRPFKDTGVASYYFKPKNKYPSRIYIFMHNEEWNSRNRRPMGLQFKNPFFSRPMTKEEILECCLDWRMKYYQYESWESLLGDEKNMGIDPVTINEIENFKSQYKLK